MAKRNGVVDEIDGKRIVVKATDVTDLSQSAVDIYNLSKFQDQIKIHVLIKNHC